MGEPRREGSQMTAYTRSLTAVLLGVLAALLLPATASAKVFEYPTPTAGSLPTGIATGPDGALWFAESHVNKIGRITTSGTISEFGAAISPDDITAGPDGALWFTELGDCYPPCYGAQIGRITTSGAITHFPLPELGSSRNPAA